MRFFCFIPAAILLLSVEVRAKSEVAANREPLSVEDQLLNLHIWLDKMFVTISEELEQLKTELHHLRQSVEHLTWTAEQVERAVQNVESNNDLLMRNVTIISQQSDNIMMNQQYCANHEELRDLFFELTPRCEGIPPILPSTTTPEPPAEPVYQSCTSVPPVSGVYRFTRPDGVEFEAACEQDLHGGHWMVFQSRQDGSVDFNRSWSDYRNGFGDAQGEVWLGLDTLHLITRDTQPELLIVMENFTGHSGYAMYDQFWVDSALIDYTLRMNPPGSGFIAGDSGDSMTGHRNYRFGTYDHPSGSKGPCSDFFASGYWRLDCTNPFPDKNNFNGIYGLEQQSVRFTGIFWARFGGVHNSLNPMRKVRMMIRY